MNTKTNLQVKVLTSRNILQGLIDILEIYLLITGFTFIKSFHSCNNYLLRFFSMAVSLRMRIMELEYKISRELRTKKKRI